MHTKFWEPKLRYNGKSRRSRAVEKFHVLTRAPGHVCIRDSNFNVAFHLYRYTVCKANFLLLPYGTGSTNYIPPIHPCPPPASLVSCCTALELAVSDGSGPAWGQGCICAHCILHTQRNEVAGIRQRMLSHQYSRTNARYWPDRPRRCSP